MQEPIAWMVTNMDGQDAYVTADPTLANSAQHDAAIEALKERLK